MKVGRKTRNHTEHLVWGEALAEVQCPARAHRTESNSAVLPPQFPLREWHLRPPGHKAGNPGPILDSSFSLIPTSDESPGPAVPTSKYISNLPTSLHPHCQHPGPNLSHLLPGPRPAGSELDLCFYSCCLQSILRPETRVSDDITLLKACQ